MSEKSAKAARRLKTEDMPDEAMLALTEKARIRIIRDLLGMYKPLLPLSYETMQEILGQMINDIIMVGEKYDGSFPRALGEVPEPTKEETGGRILDQHGAPAQAGSGDQGSEDGGGGTEAASDDGERPAEEEGEGPSRSD